jgi:hypothetical protein
MLYSDMFRLEGVIIRLSSNHILGVKSNCAHLGSQRVYKVCCDNIIQRTLQLKVVQLQANVLLQ